MFSTSTWAATSTTALGVARNRTLFSAFSGGSGRARPAIDHGSQRLHSLLLSSHLGIYGDNFILALDAVQLIRNETLEGAHWKDNEIVVQQVIRFMENTVHCTRWCSAAGSNQHNKSVWKSSRSARRRQIGYTATWYLYYLCNRGIPLVVSSASWTLDSTATRPFPYAKSSFTLQNTLDP